MYFLRHFSSDDNNRPTETEHVVTQHEISQCDKTEFINRLIIRSVLPLAQEYDLRYMI